MPKPIAIDLFAGVGGMSLGVKQAGFTVAGAFDIERRNVQAYKRNFPSVSVNTLDLARTTGSEIRQQSSCIDEDIDLVFGGPPCQGFSVGGKRDAEDDRNFLIFDFIRLVRSLRPKYFVMENVQGFLAKPHEFILDEFIRRARLAGYQIAKDIRALNASDFGVPQRRKRVFVLGYRNDCEPLVYPYPTPIADEFGTDYQPLVGDAISDLPEVEHCEYLFESDSYSGHLAKTASHYAKLMRNELIEYGDNYSVYRSTPKVLTGCQRTRHSRQIMDRFRGTRPGAVEPISRYYRLDLGGVAPTLRAGTGSDRGSHTSPRPIHPEVPRCITVREAARLHSFPDWFQFDATRWHAYRQIGNSVPPRLSRSVASVVRSALT